MSKNSEKTTSLNPPKANLAVRGAIIALHALVGWMFCGALIWVGQQFMSLQRTLIVHAIGAPLVFALITWLYFKKFAYTSPLMTAALFLGIVIGMDVFVVGMLIEKSFPMLSSSLDSWLPFSLIFCATYLTGEFCRCESTAS